MKTYKCLAFIWPIEEYKDKEMANCYVRYVTGPFAHKTARYNLKTDIYRYYYWGVTFEVVTIDEQGTITEVADVKKGDLAEFGMGIVHAITYNSGTHEVLASNGFVYKLDQSLFYRNCKEVCEYIYEVIEESDNFVMQMYTMNGGIISILFDRNLDANSKSYKYAVHKGFVTGNSKLLRSMVPKTQGSTENKEVLTQRDIDRIIEGMTGEGNMISIF